MISSNIGISDFFKKRSLFGQKISKILCLVFDFICIYYIGVAIDKRLSIADIR